MIPTAIKWQNCPANVLQEDATLAEAWDRLNAEREGLPFLDAKVISVALEVFGAGGERLLIGWQGGKIVAMLVLLREGRFRWITFQPSQIPLGAWVSDKRLSPIEISRSLCQGSLGFCLAVSLTQLDPRLTPREADTADSESIDYIDTGWLDLTGSFDEYWAARGKNLRQNMRKQRNKLASDGIETHMKEYSAVADMAGVIERYGLIESIGWKSGRGTAIHPDNDQGRFYRTIFESAAARNEAIAYEYLFGEQVVAMNLCLFRAGVLIVLKTTYDESIPSTYSPAFLLRQDELTKFYADGKVNRLEYYGRLMDWHTKLTDNKRTLFHLTTYRWPLIKRLAQWRRQKRQEVKSSSDATAE